MHIPSTANPPGPVGELINVGLTKRPFERLGHLVHVDGGELGEGEAFGLVDQFGVGYEQLAEQMAALVAGEPVEGGGVPPARSAHGSGHSQPAGRWAGNGGRPRQVRWAAWSHPATEFGSK